jgi:type 1 glutamine amidotransferase
MRRISHTGFVTLMSASFILFAMIATCRAEPIRVLVLLGGEYHPYEAGSKMMIEAASKRLDIKADFVRIDNPPEGFPKAEKATIPSNIAILADPDLNEKYDVILAYNQSNWVKITEQQMEGHLSFVRNGGGLVAVHSTTETFQTNPEYVRMLGGSFVKHEPYREMHIMRIEGDHPILEGIKNFDIMDEFYYHDQCDLEDKHVLLVCQSPDDQRVHPIAWTKTYGKGRVFFTALGHSVESCSNPSHLRIVTQAIAWVTGRQLAESGFIDLYNGKDLSGWEMTGPGEFVREKDGSLRTEGGMGLLWYKEKKFKDFVLDVEWKAEKADSNSGVFVRFPNPPESPWDAVNQGYEIQIADSYDPIHRTGSIYSFKEPTTFASRKPARWNTFRITVVGQKYTIELNGVKVNQFTGERGEEGYIGLQNHLPADKVWFRSVRVKELK